MASHPRSALCFCIHGPCRDSEKTWGFTTAQIWGQSCNEGIECTTRNLKRSRSSTIADLNLQLERVKRKYFDEPAPVSDAPLRKRIMSGSVNLTDLGYDSTYSVQVQVGTPRRFYATLQPSSFTNVPCIASKRKPSTSKLQRKRQYHPKYETACLPIHPQRVGRLLAGIQVLLQQYNDFPQIQLICVQNLD
jgi:hypothetical protein